jgi:hypothetical protein
MLMLHNRTPQKSSQKRNHLKYWVHLELHQMASLSCHQAITKDGAGRV